MAIKLPKVEELFEAGVHFGHQLRRWNPNMEKYIYTARSGIHIIDLENTRENLKEAAEFLKGIAAEGGQIIFVGTKKQATEVIKLEAERCGALYVNERWLGGTITNFSVIKKNIKKYLDLVKGMEEGEFKHYTKKERLMIDREIAKLELSVGGIVNLRGKPAAIFVVDSKREKTVVREATKAGIPIVALLDTNSDPTVVDYPIPGNDDAIRSIAIVTKVIADAIEEGYSEYGNKKHAAEKKLEEEKAAEKVVEEVQVSKSESAAATQEQLESKDKPGKAESNE